MIWSIVLGALGVTSLWLAGSGTVWAWFVGLGTQCVWVVYAVVTVQPGFLVSCAAFIVVYVRNLLHWGSGRVSINKISERDSNGC